MRKRKVPAVGTAGGRLHFGWRGLAVQMILTTILPLATLLLLVAFGSVSLHHRAMRTLVGERDAQAARAAAGNVDGQLQKRADLIQVLAWQDFGDYAQPFSTQMLNMTRQDFEGGVALLDAAGTVLWSDPDGHFWQQYRREGIRRIAALSPSQIGVDFSEVFKPAASKEAWALMVSPTPQGYRLAGAFLPEELVSAALRGVIDEQRSGVVVVDGSLQVLYASSNHFPAAERSDHAVVRNVLAGLSGVEIVTEEAGEWVTAYAPVKLAGWGLILQESWEEIASPLLLGTQIAPLVLVPLLILALMAIWFGINRIVKPLQTLEMQARRLGEGDFSAVNEVVGGIGEVRSLQACLAEMAQRLEQAQSSLRGYIGAISAGAEHERLKLGRELHDDTLQGLIALQQRIRMAQSKAQGSQLEAPLAELENLIGTTIDDLRRTLRGLRPLYLEDLGLAAALENLTQEMGEMHNTTVRFKKCGNERRLDQTVELGLYRMAQEALTNAVRHAEADLVRLTLEYRAEGIRLEVADDGKGFSEPRAAAFARQGHYGLLGLKERAEELGAQLQIVTSPGRGTRVTVKILKNGKQ